jgi:hypothetical protein
MHPDFEPAMAQPVRDFLNASARDRESPMT